MALTLETRRVSKGVRYPENKRTPLLTRRVTFLKSVPMASNRPSGFDPNGGRFDSPGRSPGKTCEKPVFSPNGAKPKSGRPCDAPSGLAFLFANPTQGVALSYRMPPRWGGSTECWSYPNQYPLAARTESFRAVAEKTRFNGAYGSQLIRPIQDHFAKNSGGRFP